MTGSITRTVKSLAQKILIFIFWVALWWIISLIVSEEILVPAPDVTARALVSLLSEKEFYLSCLLSLLRVLAGFAAGVAIGFFGGIAASENRLFDRLFSPVLRLMRAVPVASFIILALVLIKTDMVPFFISLLTVTPIVWSGSYAAMRGLDPNILEMAQVFKVPKSRVFFKIKLPGILPASGAAAATALGFGWKSAVAAEVICRPDYSLGDVLWSGKITLETPKVFAVSAVIIILSLLFEKLLKFLLKKLPSA